MTMPDSKSDAFGAPKPARHAALKSLLTSVGYRNYLTVLNVETVDIVIGIRPERDKSALSHSQQTEQQTA